MPSALRLTLPLPPSVNAAYRNLSDKEKAILRAKGKGVPPRVSSAALKAWKDDAGWRLQSQPRRQFVGPFRVRLYVPMAMRGDVDGRLKAAIDLLVAHKITPDDRFAKSVSSERCEAVPPGECLLVVEAA